MKIKSKLPKYFKRETVQDGIRICIECGSTLISYEVDKLKCKECGTTKHFQQ